VLPLGDFAAAFARSALAGVAGALQGGQGAVQVVLGDGHLAVVFAGDGLTGVAGLAVERAGRLRKRPAGTPEG
jgi:hypothetical protein